MIPISRYPVGRHQSGRRIKIQKPVIRSSEDEQLWRHVQKYTDMAATEPDPNRDRVREIKEELRKGNYPTPEMIDDAASNLSIRFTRSENQSN